MLGKIEWEGEELFNLRLNFLQEGTHAEIEGLELPV
jgi:hypothetical protein